MSERGILIIISGPSGVGKGTVRQSVFEKVDNLHYSISMTTRSRRDGEIEGKDYYFVTKPAFQEAIEKGRMLEWAEFVGNYYGTPLDKVEAQLNSGHDVVLEIEIQGALQVKEKVRDALFIFLMPTSIEELKARLRKRGSESNEIIAKRIEKAKKEIPLKINYDYVVINDDVDRAADEIIRIIKTEKELRREI